MGCPFSVVDRRTPVPRLSAIVITRNEAAKIADCLDSLAFCDERIVVDCGSEDDTARIAREHGARVEHHAFEGFGAQKNFALSLASGEWVLSVDADERVSPALAAEITTAIGKSGADGYEMPRSSSFLGRTMRHSGWYPDYVLRVFRRGRTRFSDKIVHERVVCEGPVRRLREPLLHVPVDRIEDALSRMDRYSSAGAEQMVASGRRVTFASGFLHGFWTFVRIYVLRAGFLDGREGLLLAIATAEGSYYRYMKAWLLARRRKHAGSGADSGATIRTAPTGSVSGTEPSP
jgi:glycosyltransferase involved in cell wall biosynthesis